MSESGAAEAFGKENDTQVAKVAWLSNREVAKASRFHGYLPQQGIGRTTPPPRRLFLRRMTSLSLGQSRRHLVAEHSRMNPAS